MTETRRELRGRLCLLCQHFYPEMISTGMHMTELAGELRRRGWDVTVFCAQPSLELDGGGGRAPSFMRHEGIKIHRVRALGSHGGSLVGRLVFGASYLAGTMWHLIREAKKFDVALVTTNPPYLGLAGIVASKLRGLPFVQLVYDVYPDIAVSLGLVSPHSPITRMSDRITRWILRDADGVIVIGRDMAEIVGKKIGSVDDSTLNLIPNWSNERNVYPVAPHKNQWAREYGLGDDFVLQYSGRMGRTHNLEVLIEAAELLRGHPIRFQLIGDGAKRATLLRMVDERGLTNVQFLPYQPLERLHEVLSAADLAVVCLDRRFTGFSVPSKAYGIMASGTPLLGLLDPCSEIGRMISSENCGVVLDQPSGETVARTIRRLAQDREHLARLGKNSLKAFRERYTLRHAGRRYDTLLHSTARSTSNPSDSNPSDR